MSLAAVVPLLAAISSAQTLDLGKNMSLELHGMISATGFAQDQDFSFGNGQNAEWPNPPESTVDRWFGGGDVRNTRLTLLFKGPTVIGNWKVGTTLETDFFGGNNGTGAFSGQQLIPRLRLAFIDLSNGCTTIRLGQNWAPLWGNLPVSLSHIAFPLGWAAGGLIGWRYPGLFVYQQITAKDAPVNLEVQAAVMSNNWDGPGSNTDFETAGNGAWPQFELRLNASGKSGDASWSGYVVGHVDGKDLSGPGESEPGDTLTGSAVEIGGKLQLGRFLLQGNGYTGHNIGQQFSTINQFGKIQSHGGWVQLGFDFTEHWSVFAWGGIDDPKDSDVLAEFGDAARLKNIMYSWLLRWKAGPLAFGLEYLRSTLTTGPERVHTAGQQIAFSGLYTF
jgi:hypothetical protein